MKIKPISKNDFSQFQAGATYCFEHLSDEWVEWYKKHVFPEVRTLGAFVDDRLASSLTIIPFEMYFREKAVNMGGISLVYSLPEFRNRSFVRDLIVRSLEIMKDNNQNFSLLAPFSYPFYYRYGWAWGINFKKYKIPLSKLENFKKGEGEFRPIKKRDLPEIKLIYEYFAQNFNGPVKRTEKNWQLKYRGQPEQKKYWYCYENGQQEIEGYIIFSMEQGKIKIEEFCCTDIDIKKYFFNFLYKHRAQCSELVWRAPEKDSTLLLISEPEVECSFQPDMMVRIVDLQPVLKEYFTLRKKKDDNFDPGSFDGLKIKVNDEWAPWNKGCFEVESEQNRVRILRNNKQPDLTVNINVLSQLLFGFINFEQAQMMDSVNVKKSRVKKLNKLFCKHPTFINDFF